MKKTKLRYFGATDVGLLRDHNEDSFVILDLTDVEGNDFGVVLMVADGMGGANAGEVASNIACKVVEDRYLKLKKTPSSHRDIEKYLNNLTLEAHYQILEYAKKNSSCQGMGTTSVIAWIINGYLHLVWCGDSRCYLYKKHQQYTLAPFSDDHSLVWQMVKAGELTAEEARVHEQSNIILQVLGSVDSKPSPSYKKRKLEKGEYIMLCSDGLNGMVSDASIQQIFQQQTDVTELVHTLIASANDKGGTDNITVVFAEVEKVEHNSAKYPESRGGMKKLWPFLLFLVVITLFIFFTLDIKNKQYLSEKNDADLTINIVQEESVGIEVQEKQANNTSSLSTKKTSKVNPSLEVSTSTNEYYDFHNELIKLKIKLDNEVSNGRKALYGCEDCNSNLNLESFNSNVSGTIDFLENQITLAQENQPLSDKSRQQLKEIASKFNVSYDPIKSFEIDSYEEHKYIITTIHEVITKIKEEIRIYTTTLQEKK